jgi:hypothetical protein
MKCPRCGAGISTKLLDRPHFRYMKHKYRRYAPTGIRRAVCSLVVSSDPLQQALDGVW